MIKNKIRFILLTSIFSTQFSLNAFSMEDDIQEINRRANNMQIKFREYEQRIQSLEQERNNADKLVDHITQVIRTISNPNIVLPPSFSITDDILYTNTYPNPMGTAKNKEMEDFFIQSQERYQRNRQRITPIIHGLQNLRPDNNMTHLLPMGTNLETLMPIPAVTQTRNPISMQNEEDDLETRARRSMDIAGNYVRAYGRLVHGDDNTPCPTLTFEAHWAKAGFSNHNVLLLKNAIIYKQIPISVRVIATDTQDREIWHTERNDNDPRAPVKCNYDEIIKRAASRMEAFSQQRAENSDSDEEGEEEIGTGENVYDFEQDEVLYRDGFDHSYVDPKKEAEQERKRIEKNNFKG